MNIRNFCFFPMGGNSLSRYLSMSRYLWMPIEASGSPMMPLNDARIVFNLHPEEIKHLLSYCRQQEYRYYEITDTQWKEPSSLLPVSAIAQAYTFCDKAIEWGKNYSAHYRSKYDEHLSLLLEPNRTGYSRWLHRCRLYGGLLEKYRQSMLD